LGARIKEVLKDNDNLVGEKASIGVKQRMDPLQSKFAELKRLCQCPCAPTVVLAATSSQPPVGGCGAVSAACL